MGKRQLDEGITYLERAVAINPDLGWAHLQLGLLYALRGDYERAEATTRRTIDMQERFISEREDLQILGAFTRLGYVYYLQDRYDEALRTYHREVTDVTASDHA